MFIKQGVHCWMGCFKKKRGWHELRVVHPFLQGPLHHWSEPCLLPRTYTCNLWKCSLVLHRSVGTTHMVTTRASNYLTRSLSPTEQSAAFSTGRGNQLACLCKCKQSTGLISGARVWLAPPPPQPGSPHSCRLPKQTPVSCPSVSCCMSPPVYRHGQKAVWGFGSGDTHTDTHIAGGAVSTFKAICLCSLLRLLSHARLCSPLICQNSLLHTFHSWPSVFNGNVPLHWK